MVPDASGAMVDVPPAAFVAAVKASLPDTSRPLLVGCRSGVRSQKAIVRGSHMLVELHGC
jgi:rhodanese-related sulfurtransferase